VRHCRLWWSSRPTTLDGLPSPHQPLPSGPRAHFTFLIHRCRCAHSSHKASKEHLCHLTGHILLTIIFVPSQASTPYKAVHEPTLLIFPHRAPTLLRIFFYIFNPRVLVLLASAQLPRRLGRHSLSVLSLSGSPPDLPSLLI
jgi:hypothetical protein